MSRSSPYHRASPDPTLATSSKTLSRPRIPPVHSPLPAHPSSSSSRLPSLTQLFPWNDETIGDPKSNVTPVLSSGHAFITRDPRPHQTEQRHQYSSNGHLTPAPLLHPPTAPRTQAQPSLPKLLVPGTRRGPVIPQRKYQPLTASDRRRYVEEVDLNPSISFSTTDGGEGFLLKDALNHRYGHLASRDEPMFAQHGPSISLRLNWPGYQPWTRQIPTRDFRNPPGPITRDKLTKNVAKSIQRFIEEQRTREIEPSEVQWRVGEGFIELEDLVLLRLDNVSKGSWQIQLQLSTPLENNEWRSNHNISTGRQAQPGSVPPPRQLNWKHVGPVTGLSRQGVSPP